jgi:glycosyltransferase involved in cell wall biosynthesis
MNPLKVCIVGLKCHDHLTGVEVPRYLGGIETQLATLAKGLVREGCEVSVITFDHGQAEDERSDGVWMLKSHPPEGGIRFLRALHPRTSGLFRAMRRADAAVYLQMGAEIETGQTAFVCSLLRRRFVFCLASDGDFGAHLHAGRWGLEGKGYRFGLRRADQIIAQTETQRRGLRLATGLDSSIIPMAIMPPSATVSASTGHRPHVLWVGRIIASKRLDRLLEAARKCPDTVFDIVGTPNQESGHATALMREASQLSNVVVHGRVPASTLASLYAGASLLCCTSELEGFPTTFLEAWSCGVPVVTTFDPDGIVSANGLGQVSTNLEDLINTLHVLLADGKAREPLARAARQYYKEHHSIEGVCQRFKRMLEQTARRSFCTS